MFNEMVIPKLNLKVDSNLAYIDGRMTIKNILNIPDKIWRMFAEECLEDSTFMIDTLKQQSILAYVMFVSLKEQLFRDVKMCFKQPIEFIEKIAMEKQINFKFDTYIIDALTSDIELWITNQRVSFSDWVDIKYFLHPETIVTLRDEIEMSSEVSFEQKAALDLLDALIMSISEASIRQQVSVLDSVRTQATMLVGSRKGFANVIRTNYVKDTPEENSSSGAMIYTIDSPAVFIAGNNTVEDNCRQGDKISLRDTLKIIYD
jgi:hypothetical protein